MADGGAGTDTAILGFGFNDTGVTFEKIYDSANALIGARITHTVGGQQVADEFINFESFVFTDGTRDLAGVLNTPPNAVDDTLNFATGPQANPPANLSGWVLNNANGHYYKVVTASLNWAAAETAAETAGGHLATITSAAENSFILGLMSPGQALLIGATDAAVEGTWKWAVGPEAGTAFWLGAANGGAVGGNYARWNAGEPNDSGNEDVATIQSSTGGWNDIPASFATGYVMEWSPPSAEQRGILENASKTFSADVLLGNDTDADGNTLSIVSIQTTSSRGASVSYDANTRQVTYNAASSSELAALVFGQTTTDTFSYTISDGKGGTDTATVTVTVVGKNDTPAIGTPGAGQVIEDFDLTAVQGERIINGNFQSGTSGWQIANVDPVWGGLVTAGGSTAYSIYTHNTTVPTTITETLQTTVGVTYDVSFMMNHNSTTDPSSAVTVYWGGVAYLALANIPGVGNYDTFTQYSFKALASSTSTVFQISAVSVSSSLIFDNISVKASATETTTGVLTFGDAELNDVHTIAASARAAGYVGSFQATMTDDSTGDGVGHISWLFNVDNSQIHWLAAGATLQQVYAVSVTDGFGNVGQQDVTVTIIGTNDVPVLTADTVKIAGYTATAFRVRLPRRLLLTGGGENNRYGTAQDVARSPSWSHPTAISATPPCRPSPSTAASAPMPT